MEKSSKNDEKTQIEGYFFLKTHYQQIWDAENFPVVAGNLVYILL